MTKKTSLKKEQLDKELEKLREELERKQNELRKEQEVLAEMERRAISSKIFLDYLKESGLKEYVIAERIHMSVPTFIARKKKGASLWRLDELKTIADRIGVDPLELIRSLLDEVNIIPEDSEEARELRKSYSKSV